MTIPADDVKPIDIDQLIASQSGATKGKELVLYTPPIYAPAELPPLLQPTRQERLREFMSDGRAVIWGLAIPPAIVSVGVVVTFSQALPSIIATTVYAAKLAFAVACILLLCSIIFRKSPTKGTLRGCPNSGGPTSYNFITDANGIVHLVD
jgi:type III secretory pathway component EscS